MPDRGGEARIDGGGRPGVVCRRSAFNYDGQHGVDDITTQSDL